MDVLDDVLNPGCQPLYLADEPAAGPETVNSLEGRNPTMADREPKPRNPLGPYYPSELPDLPGNGRTWFALLLVALILLGAASGLLALLPF